MQRQNDNHELKKKITELGLEKDNLEEELRTIQQGLSLKNEQTVRKKLEKIKSEISQKTMELENKDTGITVEEEEEEEEEDNTIPPSFIGGFRTFQNRSKSPTSQSTPSEQIISGVKQYIMDSSHQSIKNIEATCKTARACKKKVRSSFETSSDQLSPSPKKINPGQSAINIVDKEELSGNAIYLEKCTNNSYHTHVITLPDDPSHKALIDLAFKQVSAFRLNCPGKTIQILPGDKRLINAYMAVCNQLKLNFIRLDKQPSAIDQGYVDAAKSYITSTKLGKQGPGLFSTTKDNKPNHASPMGRRKSI